MKISRLASRIFLSAGLLATTLSLAACGDDDMPAPGESVDVGTEPPSPPDAGMVPPPPATADMQVVLDALAALDPEPITTLTPEEARAQPSFANAYRAVLAQRGIPENNGAVTTEEQSYGDDPLQFVRIYRPVAEAEEPRPVIVYYHGGGWVIADVDTYDATPRYLAEALGAIVISAEYRKAPEIKFPAQHQDASLAYAWTLNNIERLGGDPGKVALVGESAGGNLAVATAILARDNEIPQPDHIVAIYPIANTATDLPSRRDSANAMPLNTAALDWFAFYYQNYPENAEDPRINLVEADLENLPIVTIVNAEIDPLRSDGETLAAALQEAGVEVEQRTFAGVTHEFFGLGKVVPTALQAEQYVVARLLATFEGD